MLLYYANMLFNITFSDFKLFEFEINVEQN